MPLPETETPGRLQAALSSRGVRLTHQRRTILSVVETAKQHLDAAQILRHARKLDAGIDRVTVYRTLALLKRHGLIDELDLMHMQGEKHFYERRPQRDHIHMACLRCGKIMEFESDLKWAATAHAAVPRNRIDFRKSLQETHKAHAGRILSAQCSQKRKPQE